MKREILLSLALINLSFSASCDIKNVNNDYLNSSIVYLDKSNIHNFKVSEKKGASLSFTINNSDYKYNTKTTANGAFAKTIDDVNSYQVYLIKNSNPTSYPLNGDPLGADLVSGPYIFNSNGADSTTATFKNVVASGANYYYIAVRAYSGLNATGTELIKPNNGSITVWTGTTSSINKVAVSTGGGVSVSSSLQVNPSNTLTVTPNLIDIQGVTVDAQINIPTIDTSIINSYKINLCTDPSRPLSSKVLSTPLIVNRNSSQLSGEKHNITLSNINSGSYYVTIEAYSGPNGTGISLINADNEGNPYNTPDQKSKIAVSSNIVNISSNQTVTFSPSSLNYSNISINFGEFRVNSKTVSDQYNSNIAMDSSGNFVIIWQSYFQDFSYSGVYGQRYNSFGIPQVPSGCGTTIPDCNPSTGEFRVNTYTTNAQSFPSVAMSNTGNFVVSWQSPGQDGNAGGIFAQRYNSVGIPQGSEFRVNTYTTNSQINQSVAIDSAGNFVISWQSRDQFNTGYGIYAQRYNNNGVAQGSEFRVNSYTTGGHNTPRVAMDSTGNFIIAWNSQSLGDTNGGIIAQRYNSVGIPQGSEFRVNTYTTGNQGSSNLVIDKDGNFVVTWLSNGQDGSGYGIYAQRYNSSGLAQGSEFRVNTYTTGNQRKQSVAMDNSGNFIVSWSSYNQISGSSKDDIYAQRYNSVGIPQGSEFRVNSYTTDNQSSPSSAMDYVGNFVVSWSSNNKDGFGDGVYAQRFNSSGMSLY